MNQRFLVDEDTPIRLAQELQRQGYDAVHSRHVDLLGHTDAAVFTLAQKERRILITRDLGFGDVRSHPLGSHHGIILLRVPNIYVANQIVELVSLFLVDIGQFDLRGALVILRPDGYRIRREGQTD